MKSITLKRVASSWLPGSKPEAGFIIKFSEDEKKATCRLLSDDHYSRLIPKDEVVQFWNSINTTVNLQKVLEESGEQLGLDGYDIVLELRNDSRVLSISLWCPDKERYQEQGMSESYKLTVLLERLMESVNTQGGIELQILCGRK